MTWNELAKARMKALGVTQDKLGEALGITQGGMGHWLRGTRKPSLDEIGAIFQYLGINNATFHADGTFTLSGELSDKPVKKQYEYPMFTTVQAGEFAEVGTFTELDAQDWMATTKKAADNAFWLEVSGHSMTAPYGSKPSFPEGTFILVDPSLRGDVKHGDYVVAILHNQETTFKRYVIEDGEEWLEPLNTDRTRYHPILFSDGCRIIGKVVDAQWPGGTFD